MDGPTQTAKEHAWDSRPVLAFLVKALVVLGPTVIAFAFSYTAGRIAPPEQLGINRWVWWFCVFVLAMTLLKIVEKALGKLLPLAAMFKLSLVFPDQAPSRLKSTLRATNSRTVLRRLEESKAAGVNSDETNNSETIVSLLALLNGHDRLTRGHSERVQAYADLIAEELDLDEDDRQKLRWGALLHDLGKLDVPVEILNKPGRPSEDEWQTLKGHPAAGNAYIEPLSEWLGDWARAVDQHHLRWDGNGYPYDIGGEDITLSGRIVAVADAYDVMTSARSYKKPLPHETARQELLSNAGSQFDPKVVRAFMAVSLGKLRLIAGPLSWLSGGIGAFRTPIGSITSVTVGTVASAGAIVVGTIFSLDTAVDSTPPNGPVAFADDLALTVDPLQIDEGSTSTIRATATGGTPPFTFEVSSPRHGSLAPARVTKPPTGADEQTAVFETGYVPFTGFDGTDEVLIEVCDSSGSCTSKLVTIDVQNVAAAPIAATDTATVEVGKAVVIDPLRNDSDPDGQELTIINVDTPSNGTVELVDSWIRYRPDPDTDESEVTLNYTIADSDGSTARASIIITILPAVVTTTSVAPTTTPIPAAITSTTAPPATTSTTVAPTTTTVIPTTTTATTTIPATTTTAAPTTTTTAAPTTTTSTTTTSTTTTSTTTTTIAPNTPPVANDDARWVDEDSARVMSPLLNDADADADSLAIISVSNPVNGTASSTDGQTIVFVPTTDWNGIETFTYTISDGQGGTDTATVTMRVRVVNDAPVALNDNASTNEDAAISIALTSNDTDVDNDTLTVTTFSPAVNGTAVLDPAGQSITFNPDPNWNGTETLAYTVVDGNGGTDTALVTFVVLPINDPPVANDDVGTTKEDVPLVLASILGNDTDLDGDTLTITNAGSLNGTVTISPSGTSMTYTPSPNWHGIENLTYFVSDGNGGTDPAMVEVTVTPVNDAPVATDDNSNTLEDTAVAINLTSNDSDIDLDSLIIASTTSPTNGTATINPGAQTVTYSPAPNWNGIEKFTYIVSDGQGGTDNALVTIIVTAANDAPEAIDDLGTTPEDNPLTLNLITNDTDPENDPLTINSITIPTNGAVTISPDQQSVTYTPDPNWNGIETLIYTISDGNGGADTAVFEVTVTGVNDAPNAENDLTTTKEDIPLVIPALTNDTDPENDALTIINVGGANNGTATIDPGGQTITYTPDSNWSGAENLNYTISDGNGGSDSATINISVTPINDRPVVNFVANQNLVAGVPFTLSVSGTDDAAILSYAVAAPGLPTGLTGTFNPATQNFDISGTPAGSYAGTTVTVTITATDGGGPPLTSTPVLFDLVFDDIGISPFAGQIVFHEVMYAESEKYDPANPFAAYQMDEYFEIKNLGPVQDIQNFSITDTADPSLTTDYSFHGAPPYLPEHTGRINQSWTSSSVMATNEIFTGVVRLPWNANYELWDGSIRAAKPWDIGFLGTAYYLPPGPSSNWEALNDEGDDLWFWDDNGLLVAYIAWDDGSGSDHIASRPPAVAALWDSIDEARLAGAAPGQSISLSTLGPDADSSKCWEHTGSGQASAGCSGNFVTVDSDTSYPQRVSSQGKDNN